MCLLNCILISIVTLTQSAKLPTSAQSTRITLASVINEHPKFHGIFLIYFRKCFCCRFNVGFFFFVLLPDTLLNADVVPFLNECNIKKPKQMLVCDSYYEMVNKLDSSDVNGLSTLTDFTKEMSVYNGTQIEEFCTKFPGYIPKDSSYKLFTYVNRTCETFCMDDSDIDKKVIRPICRAFAIGFQLLETKKQSSIVSVKNMAINQQLEQVEKSQISEIVQPDPKLKSESTSDNANQGQGIPLAQIADVKEKIKTEDITKINKKLFQKVPKEKTDTVVENIPGEKVDEAGENITEEKINVADSNANPKENANANAESVADGVKKIENGGSDSKPIALSGQLVKGNQTQSVIPELKPTGKVLNSSTDPQTIDKSLINTEQSLIHLDNDEDLLKDNQKPVTDFNEEYNDRSSNMNGVDDSNEDFNNNEIDGEEIDSKIVSKSKDSPDQSPSKEQLQNKEDPFTDDTDSNFFTYFMCLLFVCVIAYVVYHNKSKMLALMLEGRRSSTNGRSGLSRRKHTAAYRKLDSNLEEAITSSANGRSTQVIY